MSGRKWRRFLAGIPRQLAELEALSAAMSAIRSAHVLRNATTGDFEISTLL